MPDQLPPAWVERLFGHLAVRYGSRWLLMWEGIDMLAVKADWAQELAGFQNHPQALRHALETLPPDSPPNAAQFRALCLRAPEPAAKQLPPPSTNRDAVERILAAVQRPKQVGGREWAYRLRDREQAGERLTLVQRQFWREALKPEAARQAAQQFGVAIGEPS